MCRLSDGGLRIRYKRVALTAYDARQTEINSFEHFVHFIVLCELFFSIFVITYIYCLAHLTQQSSNFIFTNMVTYQFVYILVFSLTQCVINCDKNIKREGLVLHPHYAHTVLLFYPWTLIVLFNTIHLYRGLFINYISTKIKFSEWNFDSNLFLKSVIVQAQKTTFALFIVIKNILYKCDAGGCLWIIFVTTIITFKNITLCFH